LISCSQPEVGKAPELIDEIPVQVPEVVVEEPAPVMPVVGCIDSDQGMSPFVKGVTQNPADTVSDSCLFSKTNGKVSLPKLVEYFCEGGEIVAEVVDCKRGCKDGVCLPPPKPAGQVNLLIENGNCKAGLNVEGKIRVTDCYNDCLVQTPCYPVELKTKSIVLPPQLNCLARTDQWVIEKWVEFDVLRPVDVEFSAEVLGSEAVSVEVWDGEQNLVATIIKEVIVNNRCFALGSGKARASLQPGHYEVHIGARAGGKDLLRSFRGEDFGVAFIN